MKTTETAALLESDDFKRLVARRWRASLILTIVLFVVYYGFILLVATNKPLLGTRVGPGTLGIVLGVVVILLAWVITAAYVVWANRHYDPEVRRLRAGLLGAQARVAATAAEAAVPNLRPMPSKL